MNVGNVGAGLTSVMQQGAPGAQATRVPQQVIDQAGVPIDGNGARLRDQVAQVYGAPSSTTLPPQFAAIRDMNARMRGTAGAIGNIYGGQFRRG